MDAELAAVLAGSARAHVACARAEAFADALPDGCVNLLWLDPPYYRVKNEPWDRAWDSPEGFLAWLDGCAAQWARVLAPNGSLYVCASPEMGARVENVVAAHGPRGRVAGLRPRPRRPRASVWQPREYVHRPTCPEVTG